MQVAEIVVDVPTMQTNRPWTYLIPKSLINILVPGMRVVVPFGNSNRQIQGFVVTVHESTETAQLKPVISVIELNPVLTPELIQLGNELANRNFVFMVSMYQAMLPNVMRAKYSKQLRLNQPDALKQPEVQAMFADRDLVDFNAGDVDMALLPALKAYQQQGVLDVVYQVDNRAKVKLVRMITPLLSTNEYDQLRHALRATAKKQARLLTYLMKLGSNPQSTTQFEKQAGVTANDIKVAAQKGWVEIEEVEAYRIPKLVEPIKQTTPLTLNSEQQDAYDQIVAAVNGQTNHVFLLEGVTGSGKTEIYLQVIAQVLSQNRTALMLVPEITLTPQMVHRVKGRFGSMVAVMHSGLSDGERYDEWRRVKRHEAQVVIGARSAVFAPLDNIGIIIVDEEHESSYKQEENPRYHARDVAILRAKYHNAVVVLGSATPSLESRARAQRNRYTLLRLTHRALANPLPTSEVVDMRDVIKQGGDDIFSDQLLKKIGDRIDRNEQSVLMLNRRGYANFLMCRQCGFVPMCPNCDLAMTVHQDTKRLECHICGANQPIPNECPMCGSDRIRPYGTGTQKVEEQLQIRFPNARIIRMDVDTTRKKGATDRLLTQFGQKKADILVGTQMIAKGLDFPDVTLVGILNADTTLNLPDFRASERTFQLITQVSGRAGRADKKGEVVIQTYNPQHYAIALAKQQDYERFFSKEMQIRHTWRYAPYYYSVQIKISHQFENQVAKAAYQLVEWLRNKIADDTIIFGPAPTTVRRMKNRYYYQILIKFKHDTGLEKALTELMADAQNLSKDGIQLAIDREPVSLI